MFTKLFFFVMLEKLGWKKQPIFEMIRQNSNPIGTISLNLQLRGAFIVTDEHYYLIWKYIKMCSAFQFSCTTLTLDVLKHLCQACTEMDLMMTSTSFEMCLIEMKVEKYANAWLLLSTSQNRIGNSLWFGMVMVCMTHRPFYFLCMLTNGQWPYGVIVFLETSMWRRYHLVKNHNENQVK